MGHQVTYVVFVAGQEFNEALAPSHRASEVELGLLAESGSLWNGRFISSPRRLTVAYLLWIDDQ